MKEVKNYNEWHPAIALDFAKFQQILKPKSFLENKPEFKVDPHFLDNKPEYGVAPDFLVKKPEYGVASHVV